MKKILLLSLLIMNITLFAQSTKYYGTYGSGGHRNHMAVSVSDGSITKFYKGSFYGDSFSANKIYDFTGDKTSYNCSNDEQYGRKNCRVNISKDKKDVSYSYDTSCETENFSPSGEIHQAGQGEVSYEYSFSIKNDKLIYTIKETYLMQEEPDGSYQDTCYGQYKIQKTQIIDAKIDFADASGNKLTGKVTDKKSFYLTVSRVGKPEPKEFSSIE